MLEAGTHLRRSLVERSGWRYKRTSSFIYPEFTVERVGCVEQPAVHRVSWQCPIHFHGAGNPL